MPDFSGFFAAIERALFEVATWVFLIPKTLYLVLSHPRKVPEYVRGELSTTDEGRARFHGTVSPLLLFLLVTLGPFLLVQLVQVPKAPIEGEPTGLVGSPSEFKADFEKIPWVDFMKITWFIETVDSEGWIRDWPPEDRCFVGWEPAECRVVSVLSDLARDADPDLEPVPTVDDALDRFAALVESGMVLDEAIRVVADEYGPTQALEIYDYWCSPPPGRGCNPAYDQFSDLVEQGNSPDEARQLIADEFSLREAQQSYNLWCSWPPGRGCDPAYDLFVGLVEEGRSADEAKRAVIAAGTEDFEAQKIYDYWCSPPPGRGCYPASDRFDDLLAEGMTDEEAWAAITREFGAEEVEAEYSSLETDNAEADIALTAPFAIPGSDSPEVTDYFFGDVLRWPWEAPGLYRVSFEVRDIESDELVDQSEVHEIVVKTKTDDPQTDQKGKGKPSPSVKPKGGDDDREDKRKGDTINDFLKSPETAGLALAFLMFPLVLTLATELHRGRPLTQSTIKPAFYAQCLYLSPFVVSLWIPILLGQYHPEPEQEYLFALLLAAVIFVWLVIAEVGFVRGERSVSRFKAILWLFVPVGFIVTSLIVVALLATQHKFAIVEWVGNTVMVLMLIPFIASFFVRLWRWITRKKVERPFHGGEW